MSIAGSNVIGRIWRISQDTDNSSGGAMITGTVVHERVHLRIQQQPEEMLLLQQGYETPKTWTALCDPVTLDIDERYELEIYLPTNYYLTNKRLRITNHRPADFTPSDARNYVLLTLMRMHKSHAQA
jgi:hypothetical protein